MKKGMMLLWSALIFIFTFELDRATKQMALKLIERYEINQLLSFDLVINRGVTGGIFHFEDTTWFILLSIFVALVALILTGYAYMRWQQGSTIIGESLVLSGAFSNLVDRALYSGVIDFIAVSYKGWHFPVFNIADACIVIGVCIIFFVHVRE